MREALIQTLMASLGAAGFGTLFNVHGRKLLWIAFGGGLGWQVYLSCEHFGFGLFLSLFFATVAIVTFSEILSRVLKTPVILFLVPMLIPLVPGGGLYYMMDALVRDNAAEAALRLESVALQVGAIAGGLTVMTSIMGNFFTFYYRRKARKTQK